MERNGVKNMPDDSQKWFQATDLQDQTFTGTCELTEEGRKLLDEIRRNRLKSFRIFIPMRIPKTTHNDLIVKKGKGGKHFIGKSDELKAAEDHWEAHLRTRLSGLAEKWPDSPESPFPFTGAIEAIVWFCFPTEEKHGQFEPYCVKPDRDNLEKTFWDVMQKIGVIENDSQIWAGESKKFYADPGGVYIWLRECDIAEEVEEMRSLCDTPM